VHTLSNRRLTLVEEPDASRLPDDDSVTADFPQRRPYRPPIGIPVPEEGRFSGLISLALHILIIALILAPPFMFTAQRLNVTNEGAGGPGPAGGGGGGNRGTGGELARERLRYMQMLPAPKVATPPAPQPTPPVPKIEPPKPVPEARPVTPPTPAKADSATTTADASVVAGTGGGSGRDGTAGNGPGTGGGVGSGVGTGRGSGNGPGTGGGGAAHYPPTVTALPILPLPVPSKVRPYMMEAFFDVDTLGNATLLTFNPSRDGGYNKRIKEMLLEIRFRPAVRPDGRPVRDTAKIRAEAP
jgi:protein TonB